MRSRNAAFALSTPPPAARRPGAPGGIFTRNATEKSLMSAHTVLIIDDDRGLFVLLEEYLRDEGFACLHAAAPEAGFAALEAGGVDVVILDVMLPGMNGFEVLRRLRATPRFAALPVLMLTARGDEIDRVVGLELGADDYLGKPFSARELVARLRAVLRRAAPAGAESVPVAPQQLDDVIIDRASHSVKVNNRAVALTMAELRLLLALAEHPGRVAERDTLYKLLFGHYAYPADRSLDMLVSRLRKKLGPRADGGERIKAVRGEGYTFLLSGEQT